MKQTFKNSELAGMLMSLVPLLQQRNKVGYVAARNTRTLNEALTEYFQFRDELVKKHGKEDQNGDVSIAISSPEFEQFYKEFEPYDTIEQEVDLMTLPYEEAIGILSGEELLACDWMFEE